MAHVNLIPVGRRENARRLAHIRGWVWGCISYAAAVLLLLVVSRGAQVTLDSGHSSELQRINAGLDQTRQQTDELRSKLRQIQSRLEATRSIGDRPDWSILLALLPGTTGEDVVVRQCVLDGRPDDVPRRASRSLLRRSRSMRLEMTGVGRSQHAVQQFVHRLEQTGLFDRVDLAEMQREELSEEPAVEFRIKCDVTKGG